MKQAINQLHRNEFLYVGAIWLSDSNFIFSYQHVLARPYVGT